MFSRGVLLSIFVLLQASLPTAAAERNLVTAALVGMMGEGGGDKLFYYPTKDQPHTPKKYGYAYEDVFFETSDGVKLHSWWMPAKLKAGKKALGTVVYSHGNAGSMAYHLVFVYWLVDAGYNVMMYDYRGFGKSEGEITKAGLVKDAQAAFRYVAQRKDIDATKLISFGHSLGGAKSIVALAKTPPAGLKAVMVDSAFASYKDMAERFAGKKARSVVSDGYEPYRYVSSLPEVPFLVVHGTEDKTVPFEQAKKLYDSARGTKELLTVVGGNHVNCFFIDGEKYRQKLLLWLAVAMAE